MRHRLPVLFVGHGSPMNIIGDNAFTQFLAREGQILPKPEAILVVSAHWETRGTKVSTSDPPRTIYDFGGFPEALYKIQYPAPGAPKFAARTLELLSDHQAAGDASWGLDHGAWAVLHHLFPKRDIPVFQLSVDRKKTLVEHYELATALRPLRDEGVLILASGNITHNLGRVDWSDDAPRVDWAVQFDQLIHTALDARDIDFLTRKSNAHDELWRLAHPALDHYIPLLYAVGASTVDESPSFPHAGFEHGTLSMRAVKYGS